MSLQPPSETAISKLFTRKLRLYDFSARPEAAELAYGYIMDHLADLYDRGTIGSDVNIHVDQQITLLVNTLAEITKDKKDVQFVDSSLMKQVIAILSQYHHSQNEQQQFQQVGLVEPALDEKASMSNIDIESAIKYATLKQIQPIHILDAFNAPKFSFSLHQNQYIPDALQMCPNPGSSKEQPLRQLNTSKKIHSDTVAYTAMFTHRYFSIFERTLRQERLAQQQRDENNSRPVKSTISQADPTAIYQVDSLRGSTGDLTVFGYLNEIIGRVYLESPTSQILVDLSNSILIDPDAISSSFSESNQSSPDVSASYTSNTQLSQVIAQHFSSQPTPSKSAPARPTFNEVRATPLKPASSKNAVQQTHRERVIVQQHSVFSKLFTIGCFVLLTGCVYESGNVFLAKRIQLARHEPRQQTLSLYPALQIIHPFIDYVSNPIQHYTYKQGKQLQAQADNLASSQQQMTTLANNSTNTDTLTFIKNQNLLLESLQDPSQNHLNDRIYILGEVYLHDPLTMQKLNTFFHLCNEDPPTFIIFTGNYVSPQYYQQHKYNPYILRALFDKLGDLIFNFKDLRTQTHFIFSPGSHDFIFGATLPIPPLPPSLVTRLEKNITNVTFTSNPITLRYYGRDIRVFRHDIFHTIASRDTSLFELSKCVPDSLLPIEFQQQKQRMLKREEARAKLAAKREQDALAKLQFDDINGGGEIQAIISSTEGSTHQREKKTKQLGHLEDDDDDFNLPDPFSQDRLPISHDDVQLDAEIDEEIEQGRFMGDIVVKHLTSQDTLVPDLHLKPMLWDYAQAFSLITLPDVLFLIDTPIPYNVHKHGSVFYNIGTFTGKWSFVAYCPASNAIQPAVVP